ncbi:MAG TPA: hypothetical protein VH641_07375 [Streptosporangiaceae bacterium]|jgi:hypothetical protein
MLLAAAEVSNPGVAALLGLGAAGLAAGVVAMAWNIHVRQIRLAEYLARRQFIVNLPAADQVSGQLPAAEEHKRANGTGPPPVVIDGPETVVAGQQARYRLRQAGSYKVVAWAVGGGSVSQSPDPTHPDELLLTADRPGNLTIIVRVRDGMTERRGTKSLVAVPDATPSPPITLRLFLHGWGLIAVAVLITGFAAALLALGNLTSSDFIALVVPLVAVLGVVAAARGMQDPPSKHGSSPATGTEYQRWPEEIPIPGKPKAGQVPAQNHRPG